MIHCKILNKSFETKGAMFDALHKNNTCLIDAKKAEVYKSMDKGLSVTAKSLDPSRLGEQCKSIITDNDSYYFAINTTRILDTHEDLHLDPIWERTAKNQSGKIYLVDTHEITVNSVIAAPQDVEIFTAKIPFSMLGMAYEGDTVALIYKVKKVNIINDTARTLIEKGTPLQASVRMQYVDVVACFKSDNIDYAQYNANYEAYYPLIANKEDFEEIDYFYAVKEAKNVKEGSLVLFGSNHVTGLIKDDSSNADSQKSTQQKKDTQKSAAEKRSETLNYLIDNI